MTIFWRLILAHFIADFTLQTNRVAVWKRQSRWGMAVHILTHPVVMVLCCWPYLSRAWVETPYFAINGWMAVILITFFHWLEDVWRVWSIQETGSPDSTGFFLWDQVVHLAMILAFSPTWPNEPTPAWLLPVLCAVLLMHFTSVLIYFLENDLWGKSEVLNDRKYVYIGERLIGAALFLLPGVWFLLALGWIGWVVYLHYQKSGQRTWVHVLVGNAAVVLLGLLARGALS